MAKTIAHLRLEERDVEGVNQIPIVLRIRGTPDELHGVALLTPSSCTPIEESLEVAYRGNENGLFDMLVRLWTVRTLYYLS